MNIRKVYEMVQHLSAMSLSLEFEIKPVGPRPADNIRIQDASPMTLRLLGQISATTESIYYEIYGERYQLLQDLSDGDGQQLVLDFATLEEVVDFINSNRDDGRNLALETVQKRWRTNKHPYETIDGYSICKISSNPNRTSSLGDMP